MGVEPVLPPPAFNTVVVTVTLYRSQRIQTPRNAHGLHLLATGRPTEMYDYWPTQGLSCNYTRVKRGRLSFRRRYAVNSDFLINQLTRAFLLIMYACDGSTYRYLRYIGIGISMLYRVIRSFSINISAFSTNVHVHVRTKTSTQWTIKTWHFIFDYNFG